MPTILDLSNYQNGMTKERLALFKASGVVAVILRAGCAHDEDDMLPTFVKWCRELGLPFGFYFYFYPGIFLTSQIELFMLLINEYPDVKNIWIDAEEIMNDTTGFTYPSIALNAFYKKIADTLVARYPSRIVGIYSAQWVMNTYIPQMYLWANKLPFWCASYVKYFPWWSKYLESIGATWDSALKTISISNLPKIMIEMSKHSPVLPLGMPNYVLWQCVTYIPFTELSGTWDKNIDYNITTDAKYKEIFDAHYIPPVVVPDITQSYRVTETANIRQSPGGSLFSPARYVLLNQIVEVPLMANGFPEITGGWAHILPEGWVYSKYLSIIV